MEQWFITQFWPWFVGCHWVWKFIILNSLFGLLGLPFKIIINALAKVAKDKKDKEEAKKDVDAQGHPLVNINTINSRWRS